MKKPSHLGNKLAVLWGFAEATVFFIVPDVLLTALALKHPARAFTACLFALIGALLGGIALYLLARQMPETVLEIMLMVPGIGPELVARVAGLTSDPGLLPGLVEGALTGAPYKLFVVEAARQEIPLSALIAASIPARLARFLAATALTTAIFHIGLRRLPFAVKASLLAGFWLLFYAFYFHNMGW